MGKSLFISTLILFVLTIIESSILSNLSFLIVVPDLILISSIYFSLLNGKIYGETTGFISGIFLDCITGTPLGFNSLYRTLIGYITGIFSNTVIISGIILPMLSVAIATLSKRLFIIIISLFYQNTKMFIYGFISSEFLFEFIANIILAPIIFKLLSFFKNSLQIKSTREMIDNV